MHRGRGNSSGRRGSVRNNQRTPPTIPVSTVEESWKGSDKLTNAFDDMADTLAAVGGYERQNTRPEPLPVREWVIPPREYTKDKFTQPSSRTMRIPAWKYPDIILVNPIERLLEGDPYPAADAPAILAAESAVWDLFDRVIGQHNRRHEFIMVTPSGMETSTIIAGRLRVFGATSKHPDLTTIRDTMMSRAGVRGVCNAAASAPRVDLIVSTESSKRYTSETAIQIILSAIATKSGGFITRILTIDIRLVSAIHTACMFYDDVRIVRYSDGSAWVYGRGRAESIPVWIKNKICEIGTAGQTIFSTFLADSELTSPEFAETMGVMIDSVDGVGGTLVDCTGWAARTRWEYFR